MRLYVGGLPYQTPEEDLLDLFGQVGQVTQGKGFGFVEMSNDQEAQAAIAQLNGTVLGERTITVNEARERQSNGNRGFGRDRRSDSGGYRGGRY